VPFGAIEHFLRKVKNMNQSIGRSFPDVELPDQDGQLVKLSQLVGKFPFIFSFYRGYW
jgi:peroxiredoxin